jgi:hypothetical protein
MNVAEARNELASTAAMMEAAGYAAMGSLGLQENEFAWFTGRIEYPMEPQRILRDSEMVLSSFTSNATFFGGKATNNVGQLGCGQIVARIAEPLTDGTKHQSGRNQMPVPYVARLVSLNGDRVCVDTPARNAPLEQGPVVIEGRGRNPRFRKTTVYHTQSGDVVFKSGRLISDGRGVLEDKTGAQDAFEQPDEILLPRLQEVIRSMLNVANIFEKVAWQEYGQAHWEVVTDKPSQRRPR